METSPLVQVSTIYHLDISKLTSIQAHDHARAASNATHTANTAEAISEHALAAGAFAQASQATSGSEALRTLHLLEQHHKRLAELLRAPGKETTQSLEDDDVTTASEKRVGTSRAVAELQKPERDTSRSASPRRSNPNASGIYVPRRMPPRDMSSSIASNLASARGIRSVHDRRALSPSITNQQVPGSVEVHSRRNGQAASKLGVPGPIVGMPSQLALNSSSERAASHAPDPDLPQSKADDGFQRFYNVFGSVFSKISAPLAFAGMPLVVDEPARTETAEEKAIVRKNPSSSQPVQPESDLSRYISKAALRASTHAASGSDSFYVVPTTGHTASYANILSFAEKEKRRLAASISDTAMDAGEEPENEDFVDARETFNGPSPTLKKDGRRPKGPGDLQNVVEELYTENKSLKDCIDQLTRRLHAFEMSAQSSGLRMQESIRMMKPPSPGLPPHADPASTDESPGQLLRRLKSVEGVLEANRKELQAVGRENEKLKNVVTRYRERWEKLKEGARTRREGSAKEHGLSDKV